MPTANDLVLNALRHLGVVEATETLSAEDAAYGLTVLNTRLDQWRAIPSLRYTGAAPAFANGTTNYTLPSGVALALTAQLALDLAPAYDARPAAQLEQMARDGLAVLKRARYRQEEAQLDPVLSGGAAYNLYTDGD